MGREAARCGAGRLIWGGLADPDECGDDRNSGRILLALLKMPQLADIGRVVAEARGQRRMALRALATKIAVDPEKLAALEAGRPGITTTEIRRLAEELELDSAALLLGRAEARPRTSIFLRHRQQQDFAFGAEAVLDDALEAGRALRFLNRALGCVPSPSYWEKSEHTRPGREPAREGYRLANDVRVFLGIRVEPMPDLGVMLEECFEIPVIVAALPSAAMTAVSVRDDGGACAVVLNANDPQRAQNPQLDRVLLSHELCHLIRDPSDGGLHIVIDRGDETPRGRDAAQAEKRARGFAAELLMPLAALLEMLGTPASLESAQQAHALAARVRLHFSTPWEIAVNHLNNHGFIANDVRVTLLQQGPMNAPLGASGTRLGAPGGPSVALLDRVRRASDDGIITDGQARAALGLQSGQPLPWS